MDTYLRPCRDGDRVQMFVRFARLAARTARNARRRGSEALAHENFLAASEWMTLARDEELEPCAYCLSHGFFAGGHRTRQCVQVKLDQEAQYARDVEAQTVLF